MNPQDPRKTEAEKLGYRLLQSDRPYQNQWYSVRDDRFTLPNGEPGSYTYIEHPGGVLVVPLTPQGEIILIRSYRWTIDDWCWEVPAGILGDKKGNLSPEEVARQELREEIGGTAESLEDLGWYYMANGLASLKIYYFLAHNVIIDQPVQHEATELIDRIESVPWEQAWQMARTGVINDGESALAIMLAGCAIQKLTPN